ncbi:MAG: GTPase HflX [Balneolaceae bacterium]
MIEDATKQLNPERALLVGIYGPEILRWQAKEYIDELEMLALTAGAETVDKVLQNRTHPDPGSYVGKGKLDELKAISGEMAIDTLIFDDDLTPTQIRNIERETKSKVLDRSGLILDIFASRAKTSASKTQVELAQLQYLLPRLTRFWTHLSRQSGGIGTKGPGETQIETDRRLIGRRIAVLKEKLKKLDKQRSTQRKGRSGAIRASLVGYTNAGKSTLMNSLTETNVLAEDRLFATLDSTVRKLKLKDHSVLLSDTVGFIRKLPHNLIESFKSTLDEVRDADILLHVVDASTPSVDEHMEVVKRTLEELGVQDVRTQLIFNKIDRLDSGELQQLKQGHPEAVFVSAVRGIGLVTLKKQIEQTIQEDYVDFRYKIPLTHYKIAAWLHDMAVVRQEQFEADEVDISGSISQKSRKIVEAMLLETTQPENSQ